MNAGLLKPGYIVLAVFLLSGMYVHFRGRVRHSFVRQLTSHTNLTAPYNTFVYLFSAVPNEPMLDTAVFPELRLLRDSWRTIRAEAAKLFEDGHIRAADGYNDAAFNSFFRTGWTRFYLKWYDDFLPSARQLCPETVKLLRSTSCVNAAMFASLPPGARLSDHRDPYAGSLRYHLGLITPNSDQCRIHVDGIPYYWKDGEDILFDETYIHYAVNETAEQRIILFCDVQRPLRGRVADAINRLVSRHVVKASAARNVPSEKVGLINKAFGHLFQVRIVGRELKRWNRPCYYAIKYLLFLALIYVVFL